MQKPDTIVAKKSLGQNFLNNTHVPKAMADAAFIQKVDVVLEIGPGTGALTKELLARGATVIAIEADPRAILVLKNTFKNEITAQKLTIIHGDIREVDLKTLGLSAHTYKIVANIPYYLSGFLFRHFLENEIQPGAMVFLVQKEVAMRIARDKKESLLSLSVKVFGDPVYVKTVGKGNFTPQPKVDSAIIGIHNINTTRLEEAHVSPVFFFTVLHEGFKSKRKQLLGNLSDTYDREALVHIFSTLEIPPHVRGEDLTIREWLRLCSALSIHKKSTS